MKNKLWLVSKYPAWNTEFRVIEISKNKPKPRFFEKMTWISQNINQTVFKIAKNMDKWMVVSAVGDTYTNKFRNNLKIQNP